MTPIEDPKLRGLLAADIETARRAAKDRAQKAAQFRSMADIHAPGHTAHVFNLNQAADEDLLAAFFTLRADLSQLALDAGGG